MDFNRFLSKLGITHTASSPLYPQCNGFMERMVQTVKNLLSKSTVTWSFQEVLADLRATHISMGLPSPAEILHRRNPTAKEACHVDYKVIRSMLQERQLKMKLSYDKSHRTKKERPLVIGERCFALGSKDKWLDCFIVGIHDTGRGYYIQVEDTGVSLTRNHSHIRLKGFDIPLMHQSYLHQSYLQPKTVPSGGVESDMNETSQNLVLSEASSTPNGVQPMNNSKTVLSGPSKSKPPGTSESLVSDTATRSQPSRQAKKTRLNNNPVSNIKAIPACTPKTNTSTRNRRKMKFNVTDPDLLIPLQQTSIIEGILKTKETNNCQPVTLRLPVCSQAQVRPP